MGIKHGWKILIVSEKSSTSWRIVGYVTMLISKMRQHVINLNSPSAIKRGDRSKSMNFHMSEGDEHAFPS